MAVYTIQFTIGFDNTLSYRRRYQNFVAAARKNAVMTWEGATSNIVLATTESIGSLALRLKQTVDARRDVFVIIDTVYKQAVTGGRYPGVNLFRLIPYIKKV